MSTERKTLARRGLCVHDHCPLNGPHWHGGIWRSGHVRELADTTDPRTKADDK